MTTKRGPKGEVELSPLPFKPRKSGVAKFEAFVNKYLIVPKGTGANKPMKLRPWQIDTLRPFLDPVPRPVTGGILAPRGFGKTGLMAALALYELFTGPDGNEIPIVAVDERQAGLMLSPAKSMVELNPELASRAVIYTDRIEVPGKRSKLTALPAEAKRLEGLGTWTLALADELGEIAEDTWQTLLMGAGKLPNSIALGIGTPPNRETSVLMDLRAQHQADPDDPYLAFVEWSAAGFEHHPVTCVHCLELANPQIDDLIDRRTALAMIKSAGEDEYRRKRLCQVVVTNESPFLPSESDWDAIAASDGIPDGAEVVLGVDASKNNDTTAIVIGTVADKPHFDKLAAWSKPKDDDGWTVPILEVEDAIRDAAKRYRVREVAFDPAYFTRSAHVLAAEGLNMVEYPQDPRRQTAATNDLRSGVLNKRFTHSGDSELRAHVIRATVKESDKGIRLAKQSRSRNAPKIDLATALMMCHSRASWLASQKPKRRRVASFAY